MIRKDLVTHVRRESIGNTDNPSKLSFTASTSSPDRYGDIVAQNWDLEAYRSNPVVLLNHDQYSLPIGRGAVGMEQNELVIDIEFDMDDPRAAEVARKAQKGFMNAVSVGFRPTKSTPRSELPTEHYAFGQRGSFFERSELLEVSMVTIGANPDATARFFETHKGLEDMLRTVIRDELTRHIITVSETEEEVIISFKKVIPEEPEQEEGWTEDDEDTEEEADEGYKNDFVKAMDKESPETSPDSFVMVNDEGFFEAVLSVSAEPSAETSDPLSEEEKDFYNHLISIGDDYE